MILSKISIRQPVFATMMIVALLVLGITSFFALDVDLFPDIDFPFVVVTVVYPGASAEAVELDVTKEIEDAVVTIAGIRDIQSTSQEGFSTTLIQFELGIDGIDAAAEVRDKISTIRAELPDDIEEPVIQRYDPSEQPIMTLSVSGSQSLRDLTDFVDDNIKPRLESVSGVGAATVVGGAEREIQVRLNPMALKAFDITPAMISEKLRSENVEIPAGTIVDASREWIVRTMGRFGSVDDIREMVVFTPQGRMVRLDEIAEILDTEVEATSASRLNSETAIGVQIRRQSGTNTVSVANGVKEEIESIRSELPAGMDIVLVRDNSTFIEDSIHEVLTNIIWGTALATLVIFLFLADFRTTIIAGITIPISIIATFTMMRMLGFTINMMTLLGLSLAVGLLIDDAIVVIENIYRHMEMRKKAREAAEDGTDEIGLAVSATSFAIIVVFLPVAFMSGIVGQFFYSFGITVAFALAVSLFTAFTLTPMLSANFLLPRGRIEKSRIYKGLKGWSRVWSHIEQNIYKPSLAWSLRNGFTKFVTLALATVAFVFAIFIGGFIGSEFIPRTDENQLVVSFEGLAGDRLVTTINNIKPVEQMLLAKDEVMAVQTTVGGANAPEYKGSIFVKLIDKSERGASADSLVKVVREDLKTIPGFFFSVDLQESEGGDRPIDLSLRGPDLNQLEEYSMQIIERIQDIPGAVDLTTSMEPGKPELRINLNRDLAADLGVSTYQLASEMRQYFDGVVTSRFEEGDDEYDIRVQIAEKYRNNPQSLGMLPVTSNKEIVGRDRFVVPLEQIASIERTSGPSQINRFNRSREVRVSGGVVDRPSGDVREDILADLATMNLKPGYSISAVGEAEYMAESFQNIFLAMFLAVIFIYLVLASLYNSFTDPLSIMMSQPLAIVGALLSLFFFGTPFSLMSMIGIVLLLGLVTKNAILLIDFTKQRRAQGMDRDEALLEAGPIRFRPIVMTALSTIFGVLPLALAIGAGAEFRAPIARAVIGGMISSTILTLVVIPVVYAVVDDWTSFLARIFGVKRNPAEAETVQES